MKTNYIHRYMALLSLLSLLWLAGCAVKEKAVSTVDSAKEAAVSTVVAVDIYNVNNKRITSHPSVTLAKAGQLIQAAGAQHGWDTDIQQPGYIVSTLHIRTHTAVVDIHYTTDSFSITYRSSVNLHYDASTGQIHGNYNRWVRNLENAIHTKLTKGS